jgi:hypothetical protein
VHVEELTERERGLLWNDAVAEGAHLGCVRDVETGDVAFVEAHHPFDERRGQAHAALGAAADRMRCGATYVVLPASDGGFVLSPSNARIAMDSGMLRRDPSRARRRAQLATRSPSLEFDATGVGSSLKHTTSGRFTCRPAARRRSGSAGLR